MIVITLARKPFSGTVAQTAEKHGTGGINIDGCRVGIDEGEREILDNRSGGGQEILYDGWGHFGNYGEGRRFKSNPGGRWPANLILEHKPGCKCVGDKKIASSGHWSYQCSTDEDGIRLPGRSLNRGWKEKEDLGNVMADDDGLETVAVWKCVPGCPAAEMDLQSGVTSSPSSVTRGGNRKMAFGMGRQDDIPGPGDSGGASRFFFQIQLEPWQR